MTAGFLDALGVNVVAGRRLTLADEIPSSPAVVVLADRTRRGCSDRPRPRSIASSSSTACRIASSACCRER